ncbi:MAG: ABC transporter ATP-binding protein [Oscillospiraceae bacterium]
MDNKDIIKCTNISKSFGGVKALDDVSISFKNNEITGIIGGNGAGKTTLFNIITGFTKTDIGNISIYKNNAYHNITNKSCEKLAKYGLVRTFQHIRLFNEYNVYQNVLSGAYAMRRKKDSVSYWLNILNLDKIKDSNVKSLPYGTRRLIELARCLSTGSKVIFLDEVGAGMTKEELIDVADKLLVLNDKFKITFIVIEHNMDFIKKLCKKVYAMDNGKILKYGDCNTVLNDKNVINSIIGG